jgi:hypothetical protein
MEFWTSFAAGVDGKYWYFGSMVPEFAEAFVVVTWYCCEQAGIAVPTGSCFFVSDVSAGAKHSTGRM